MLAGVKEFLHNFALYSSGGFGDTPHYKLFSNEGALGKAISRARYEILLEMKRLVPLGTQPLDRDALANNLYSPTELINRKSLHTRVRKLIDDYLVIEMLLRCPPEPNSDNTQIDFLTAFDRLTKYVLQYQAENAILESHINEKREYVKYMKAQLAALETGSTGTGNPKDGDLTKFISG